MFGQLVDRLDTEQPPYGGEDARFVSWSAARGDHESPGGSPLHEILHQSGLPLTRRPAHDREHTAALRGPLVRVAEQRDLSFAPYEGERDALDGAHAHEAPHRDPPEALQLALGQRVELDAVPCDLMRRGTDEDLAGFRALLKPRCEVHHRTDAHLLLRPSRHPRGSQRDDRVRRPPRTSRAPLPPL